MTDKHYTNKSLALNLISKVPSDFHPKLIADFAVGEGILLEMAQGMWDNADFIANDICLDSVNALSSKNWNLFNLDFLDYQSLQKSSISNFKNKIDLILINPPFSQKQGYIKFWDNSHLNLKSGIALNFLYNSLRFLKPNGYLLAILPEGCLISKRDELALKFLQENYETQIYTDGIDSNFKKVKPNIFILRIRNAKPKTSIMKNNTFSSPKNVCNSNIEIFRGKFQMYKLKNMNVSKGIPLIHTTNLKNHEISLLDTQIVQDIKIINGPAIILPRVGNFKKEKICYLKQDTKVILSDCLFAIFCDNEENAKKIIATITADWENFKKIYGGTGARYTTLEKLKRYLITAKTQ